MNNENAATEGSSIEPYPQLSSHVDEILLDNGTFGIYGTCRSRDLFGEDGFLFYTLYTTTDDEETEMYIAKSKLASLPMLVIGTPQEVYTNLSVYGQCG